MSKKVNIDINVNPKFPIHRMMIMPAIQLVLIGIGVVVQSAAMQWMGFVMFWILLLLSILIRQKENTGLTIEEAKQRIQELEMKEHP